MLRLIDWFVDAVTRVMLFAAGLLVLALIALINVEIVSRYIFNTSTLFADEYGGYALVWICLLGFAYALRTDQFLSVDAFASRLPPAGRSFSVLLGAIVGICVAGLLAYSTYRLTASNLRFGSVSIQPSATPLWIPQAILPLGFGWLCIVYVQIAVRTLLGQPRNDGEVA